jgi:enoyl-CoA hydratase/carnithine racemase
MTSLTDYRDKYRYIHVERDEGILEVRFHTDDGPLVWGHGKGGAHSECSDAFSNIARDPENRVVIMTGTGDAFSGPKADPSTFPDVDAVGAEVLRFEAQELLTSLLDIPGPVIACLNGPAYRHAEMPLLADIVLAADDAVVQDSAHFPNRTAPGDGVALVFPLLMGLTRGRYFLLTGQELDAEDLQRLGLVNEVMPREELLPRARELARDLVQQNPLVLRYTRLMMLEPLRQLLQRHLGHSLALEGLAMVHEAADRAREE